MVVNSINFWIFFIIVLIAYYGLSRKSSKLQNLTLLISSYIFYGIVDWKMCALLLIATVVFYFLGVVIAKNNSTNEKVASRLTTLGVLLGVGMLFYFKYLDFFVEQFGSLLSSIGLQNNINTFGILMPLGISFFTFKLIAYVIEVHRETMEPSKDPITFGTFIAFFPTIMSGPIDQPGKFLPQLEPVRKATYDNFSEGAKRILWGMFLKMCIADQLAGFSSAILSNYVHHNASSIILASFLYSFQLYADFCGYSEMAIGISQILGIKIAENFNRPFFAHNMAEWWRRWHMSLTTWITNYVYMPLNISFRNLGLAGICIAAILNLVIIGIWHGANYTFALFGLYHGIIIAIVTFLEKPRKRYEKAHNLRDNLLWKYSRMMLTFFLWTFGQLIFQSKNVDALLGTLGALAGGLGAPFFDPSLLLASVPIALLLFKEWKDENGKKWNFIHSNNMFVSVLSVAAIIVMIMLFGNLNGGSYIYFQF